MRRYIFLGLAFLLVGVSTSMLNGAGPNFRRGDANADGKVDIADPIWIIYEIIGSGQTAPCKKAQDADDNGSVNFSDALYLVMYLFKSGPAPKAPFPTCGQDTSTDSITCVSYTGCP